MADDGKGEMSERTPCAHPLVRPIHRLLPLRLSAGDAAPPDLVLASAVAFGCSEVADWCVYTPLRKRGFAMALICAGLAGSVVDSALFLSLAFGSLDYMTGQVVGKLWATLAVAAIARPVRRVLAL